MFAPHPGTVWQNRLRFAKFIPAQERRIKTNGAMFVNSGGKDKLQDF
jgi:hypothetical protein